jgi:hypothetical protein
MFYSLELKIKPVYNMKVKKIHFALLVKSSKGPALESCTW